MAEVEWKEVSEETRNKKHGEDREGMESSIFQTMAIQNSMQVLKMLDQNAVNPPSLSRSRYLTRSTRFCDD
jgi:hypothetical protein